MERATRSTTCSSGNERDACIQSDEDTVDTKFGSPLEARIGNPIQSERRRGVEIPLFFLRF